MIDLIIVAHNAASHLSKCLRSVETLLPGRSVQITIVDNSSTDGSLELAQNFADRVPMTKVYSLPTNLGFSGAANFAITHTSAPRLVFLDDDAELPGSTLDALVAASSTYGIVGPKVLCGDQETIFCAEFSVAPLQATGEGERDLGQRNYSRCVEALVGTCWAMPRTTVDAVGLFDESFFPSQYEDIDYCIRARLAGKLIRYEGGVSILHDRRLRDGGLPQNLANRERFLGKWKDTLTDYPFVDSEPFDSLYAAASRELDRNELKRALDLFAEARSLETGFLDPAAVALCYEQLGDYHSELAELLQLKQLFPQSAIVYDRLARCYRQLGELESAGVSAKFALELLSS